MKRLATFGNAGEASVLQSVLAGAGIAAELRDDRANLAGVQSASLFVAEADQVAALEILSQFAGAPADPDAPRDPHPAANFPFLGITGLVAAIWWLLCLIGYAWHSPRPSYTATLLLASAHFLYGLILGGTVAGCGFVIRFVWRKVTRSAGH